MSLVLMISGIVIFVVVILLLSAYAVRKRREALAIVASSMNLEFTAKGDEAQISALQQFALFTKGHSKKINNVMHGNANDIDITIMDYQFTTGGGKNSSTSLQTVILFRSEKLNLPAFILRPEHFFHKIGAAFGYQDINFPSHPVFSKQYLLQGENEQPIRDLFTDDLLGFYTQRKGFCTEAAGDQLIFYRFGKKAKPERIKDFMQEGFGLFGLLG